MAKKKIKPSSPVSTTPKADSEPSLKDVFLFCSGLLTVTFALFGIYHLIGEDNPNELGSKCYKSGSSSVYVENVSYFGRDYSSRVAYRKIHVAYYHDTEDDVRVEYEDIKMFKLWFREEDKDCRVYNKAIESMHHRNLERRLKKLEKACSDKKCEDKKR